MSELNTVPIRGATPEDLLDSDRTVAKRSGSASQSLRTVREAVFSFPELIAILASFPLVLTMLVVGGGVRLFAETWAGLTSGDVSAQLLVFALLIYSIVATLSLNALREGVAAQRRECQAADDAQDLKRKVGSIRDDIDDLTRTVAHLKLGLRETHRSMVDLSSSTSRLARNSNGPTWIRRENTDECWDALVPGTTYYSIGGGARLDVDCEWRASERVFVPNLPRLLKLWMPRFAEGSALKRAIYVFYLTPGADAASSVPDAIAKHLIAFRALKRVGRDLGVELHLERARFVIKTSDEPRLSVFIGTKLVGGAPTEFVNTYTSDYANFFMEETVETSFGHEDVRAAKRGALNTIGVEPQLTLDELEARFGASVPAPVVDLPVVRGASVSEGVTNGDHFTI